MAVQLLEGRYRTRARREQGGALAGLRHVDLLLIGPTLLLSAIGVVIVYSATRTFYPHEPSYFAKRQILYLVLGFCIMLVTMFVDYRRLEQWAYPLYGGVLLSLVAVFAFHSGVSTSLGAASSSAQRWIPLGPIHLQPSEIGVLAVIVAVARFAHGHDGDLRPRRLVPLLAMAAVPMLLIVKQPDLGTGIVVAVVLFALLVVAGIRLRWLAVLLALVALVAFAAIQVHLLKGYQLQRLTSFFQPSRANANEKYNLVQAENAIGAGGLKGTGLFRGQETNLGYVPVQYADFIFSAIGEQLGFIGSVAVLGLFGLISLRMLRAMQMARDTLGRVLCGGCLAFLAFSVFQNVGMNIGVMPITGIPLPFISYGGSAILAFFAAVGLVANVEMRRKAAR